MYDGLSARHVLRPRGDVSRPMVPLLPVPRGDHLFHLEIFCLLLLAVYEGEIIKILTVESRAETVRGTAP